MNVYNLRIVKTSDLILHETSDHKRSLFVQKSIEHKNIFTNPILVTKNRNKYIVLDGANRTTALREMGVNFALVQDFDYLSERLNLQTWCHILEEKKFGEIFDTIVTSYEVGSAKPDIKIYKEVLGKLNVKAEECVYIEDRIKNLEPAKILGMKTIEFKNYNQCVKDLEEILAD